MKSWSSSFSRCATRSMAVLCAGVFVACAPATARAAGVVGTGTAASCTDAALNGALAGGGLVTFNCGSAPATIDISTGTGTKMITADTTIDGGGVITISGGNAVGVFSVDAQVTFTMKNLTIANGHDHGDINAEVGGQGGGIHNDGMLTVTNSTFTGNRSDDNIQGGGGAGGGIFNDGTLIVANSTFTGNTGPFGGGISNNGGTLTVTNTTFTDNSAAGDGGGIFNCGTLTVTNSTFAGNKVEGSGGDGPGGFGGGIANSNCGPLTVANSTFTGNTGGIAQRGSPGSLTVTNSTFKGNRSGIVGAAMLRNTIVANSPCGDVIFGTITDGGHNLDDGTSCGFSPANGSLSNTNPQLDPAGLQDNGGPTQTEALCTAAGVPAGCTAASPAIDAGDQAACATAPVSNLDQRGFVRPGTGRTQCSIGAYEADAAAAGACTGDCDGGGSATVDEVITLVNIALGTAQPSACPHGVPTGAGVDIAMIIQAVNNALTGCG